MKKILSFILCAAMLLSMAVPALAAEEAVSLFDGAMMLPTVEELPAPEEAPAEETPLPEATPAPTEAPAATPAPTAEAAAEEDLPAMDGASISWSIDDNGVLTISGEGKMNNYVLPVQFGSWPPWYSRGKEITAIVVEEGITHIGNSAFSHDMSSVTSVSLPESLISIGEYAFYSCTGLSEIDLPSSLTSLGNYAFQNCTGLTEITIPASVTSMGSHVFYMCTGLTTATVHTTATSLRYAFFGCSALETVVLPEGFTRMSESAFRSCSALKNINLPEGMTIIGNKAFSDCAALASIELPESITFIGESAFSGCSSLESIVLPEGLTSIGQSAFYKCTSLRSVTLPDTLTAIQSYTFSGCSALESINFPKCITSLGKSAFYNCAALRSMPLPDTLTTLDEFTFAGCTGLTEITIPGSVSIIPASLFKNCTGLTSVVLEEGVTELKTDPFVGCTALTEFHIPLTLTTLQENALLSCTALTAEGIIFPEGYEVDWYDSDWNIYTWEDILAGNSSTLTADWRLIWTGMFADVDESDWFYEYVKYCYQYELMNGISDTLFDPYSGATRAEVVTVLYRMAGEPTVSGSASFGDIYGSEWYADAVSWAAGMGITTGYEDGTFRPNRNVTRQEFIVFLHRFADKYLGIVKNTWSNTYYLPEDTYLDAGDIEDWGYEAELWSVYMGLQTGTAAGSGQYYLEPQDSITRAELATFLCRFAGSVGYIAFEETMQDVLGKSTSYAKNQLGSPDSTEKYTVDDPDYPDIKALTYWYYDDFWLAVYTLQDGSSYVGAWGYYEE